MPLYMDFHKIAGLTIEEVRKAHLADLAVQERYGVKYHQFWLNQEAGTIFCLTEGPDMATCEMVHRLAHGNVACAMTEVQPGYLKIFMGEGHQIDHGIVRNNDGSIDLGYRTILVATLQPLAGAQIFTGSKPSPAMERGRKFVLEKIRAFQGRLMKWSGDDSQIAVFNDTTQCIKCASAIRGRLLSGKFKVIFRIGIGVGQPVTEDGDFYTTALQLSRRLSRVARGNEIIISSLAKDLCDEDLRADLHRKIRSLTLAEEDFITDFLKITEEQIADERFTIDRLCQDMGVSRPQLYRKITAISGRSPNELLRDLRMDRAMSLLRTKTRNVSEVALEVGYSSPSYFARCFAQKFGLTPSRFQRG